MRLSIGRPCTIFAFFNVEYYRDLEIGVTGHSTSLKLVPFESLGAVSYSPSIGPSNCQIPQPPNSAAAAASRHPAAPPPPAKIRRAATPAAIY